MDVRCMRKLVQGMRGSEISVLQGQDATASSGQGCELGNGALKVLLPTSSSKTLVLARVAAEKS